MHQRLRHLSTRKSLGHAVTQPCIGGIQLAGVFQILQLVTPTHAFHAQQRRLFARGADAGPILQGAFQHRYLGRDRTQAEGKAIRQRQRQRIQPFGFFHLLGQVGGQKKEFVVHVDVPGKQFQQGLQARLAAGVGNLLQIIKVGRNKEAGGGQGFQLLPQQAADHFVRLRIQARDKAGFMLTKSPGAPGNLLGQRRADGALGVDPTCATS